MLRKIAYFLQLIDEEPRIILSNIAFLVILGKIIVAQQVDWTALITLSITCLNMCHERQTNVSPSQSVSELTDKLKRLEDKVMPIVDKLKGMST